MIILESEQKQFEDKEQAVITLAFCHYPVTVVIDDDRRTFSHFDEAKDWVLSHK